MIKYKLEEIDSMHINGLEILSVYMRGRLIWPIIPKDYPSEDDPSEDTILSCYYNGYWIDEYPWTDETPWTDNVK